MNSWLSMRLLVLSLLGIVLVASISLGLLFDHLFASLSEKNNPMVYQQEKAMLQGLAAILSDTENPQQQLQRWQLSQARQVYSLALVARAQFPLPDVLQRRLNAGEVLLLESEQQLSLHTFIPNHALVLTLVLPATEQNQQSLKWLLTLAFYLALALVMLFWLYPLMLRLFKLREAAKALGSGELSARVEVGSISYIKDIELEFNRMADRIQNLIDDIKLLSSAVSHDLRTPLARIRFGVETMAEETDPTQRQRYEARIVKDVDEMVELVEQLLDFARLEQKLLSADNSTIALKPLVESRISACSQGQKHISIDLRAQTTLQGNRLFLDMLLNNVLGNAIKFANSQINVSLYLQDNQTVLCVEDDGPGIPVELRQKVLQPFVREQHNNQGYGLGLAVVKRICQFYSAQIQIESSTALGGAKVLVCFNGEQNQLLKFYPPL